MVVRLPRFFALGCSARTGEGSVRFTGGLASVWSPATKER